MTLADLLAQNLSLRIFCNQCGHKEEKTALELSLAMGEQQRMDSIARRLKCSACNTSGKVKGAVYVLVDYPEEPRGAFQARC